MDNIRIRFIERDWLQNKLRSNTTYISDEQINNYLDELDSDDITFIFTITSTSSMKTKVIDNRTNREVSLDNLNTFAWNFYLEQTERLSRKQASDRDRLYINKIRDILYKKDKQNNYAKAN